MLPARYDDDDDDVSHMVIIIAVRVLRLSVSLCQLQTFRPFRDNKEDVYISL